MPNIGPKHSTKSLRKLTRSRKTADGGRTYPALPAVTADTQAGTLCNNQNRQLSRLIDNAVRALKIDPGKSDVPRFVVAWRMYPNAAHPDWKARPKKGVHFCSCSCGCSTTGEPETPGLEQTPPQR